MPRKQKTQKVLTTKEIVIPVGSEATVTPYMKSSKTDFVSVLISHDKNGTSEWTMPVEDAIRLGFIENTEKEQSDE
jgi:hypothetical protein